MKRLLLCLITLGAISLFGCDKGDDWLGDGGVLNINGQDYKVTTSIGMYGRWSAEYNEGNFTVALVEKHNEGDWILYNTFYFTSNTQPKVGDDFAQMKLELDSDNSVSLGLLTYKSGEARMVAKNKEGSQMTVSFRDLKMTNGKETLVFNGKAVVIFDFYPDL